MAELAEGAPLLREYGVDSSIEGSNPSLSAKNKRSRSQTGFFDSCQLGVRTREEGLTKIAGSDLERRASLSYILYFATLVRPCTAAARRAE